MLVMKIEEKSTKISVNNYDIKVTSETTVTSVMATKTTFKAITGASFTVVASKTVKRKVEFLTFASSAGVSALDVDSIQTAISKAFIASRTGMI